MADNVVRGECISFRGTPVECEAMVRRHFACMRALIKGYTDSEGHDNSEDLDKFDRTVWDIEIYSTNGLAMRKVRPELVDEASMMETLDDLYDMAIKNGTEEGK